MLSESQEGPCSHAGGGGLLSCLSDCTFCPERFINLRCCVAVHIPTSKELEMIVVEREQVCASQPLMQAIYNIKEHFR